MNKLIDSTDKVAIVLSFVCVIHCIALPVVLIALPSISGLLAFDDEVFHLWLLFAVIPISLFATTTGYFHHRRKSVLSLGLVGMAVLVLAALVGHDLFGHTVEVIMTFVGSLLIAYAHLRNLNSRRTKQNIQSVQI